MDAHTRTDIQKVVHSFGLQFLPEMTWFLHSKLYPTSPKGLDDHQLMMEMTRDGDNCMELSDEYLDPGSET
jgi:hypothetical protein